MDRLLELFLPIELLGSVEFAHEVEEDNALELLLAVEQTVVPCKVEEGNVLELLLVVELMVDVVLPEEVAEDETFWLQNFEEVMVFVELIWLLDLTVDFEVVASIELGDAL